MTPFLAALLFTVGSSAWVYNKLMKQTGNITERAVKATAGFAVIIFIVTFLVFNAIM